MTPRPRWRAYLLLARISNAPTVWSNVVAGVLVASTTPDWPLVVRLIVAASAFYIGGMFLNDAFDADFDAHHRPERPIPAGDVSQREAVVVGTALLAGGLALLPRDAAPLTAGLVLVAAIVIYDYRHKGYALAPLLMGACRGLVYVVAGLAVAEAHQALWIAAAVLTAYVTGLTFVARAAGAQARWLVPALIAGISLVDAAIIATHTPSWTLALLAACGFPLTLLLQRVVPGD